MNKFALSCVTLGFILAACSPNAQAPTNAPASAATATLAATGRIPSVGDTPVGTPAITAVVGALTRGTATPAGNGQGTVGTVGTVVAATVGGPLVITAEPANGTSQPGGTPE